MASSLQAVDMVSFNSLPIELQIHVLSYAQTQELKSARLVSRTLRLAASIHLFSSVLVARRRVVLAVLDSISQHPEYFKFVKEIRIDGSFYHPYLATVKDTYQQINREPDFSDHTNFTLRVPLEYRSPDEIPEDLEEAHEQAYIMYREYYEEQEALAQTREDFRIISESLARLPVVSRVILLPQRAYLPEEKYFAGIGSIKLQRHERYYDHIRWHHTDGKMYSRTAGLFWCVMEALHQLHTGTVKHLSIGNKAPSHYLANAGLDVSHLDYETMGIANPNVLPFIFRSLTVLELHLPCLNGSLTTIVNLFVQGKLSSLLAGADKLEVLKLCLSYQSDARRFETAFSSSTGQPEPTQTLRWIIGPRTWPKLRELSIMHLDVHDFELADLVRRHSNSLRKVNFSNVELLSGRWRDLVRNFVKGNHIAMMELIMIYDNTLFPKHQPHDQNEGYWGRISCLPDGTRIFEDTATAAL